MLRALLGRLAARLERRGARSEKEEGQFLPSRLDASVLFAHGASKDEGEREIADIEAKVRSPEAQRRRE